ncbi:MAG: hypothetical protein NTY53_23345 [Kiritimatiellaeota bacterium]|nr:hypothetical protein [Kiritimatiellota bacterium]
MTTHRREEAGQEKFAVLMLEQELQASTGTANAYRIAGYTDGLIGSAEPDCDILLPHYDSGLTWPDANNPRPDDPLWGGGVDGGIKWDGTFWRDLARYSAGGPLFWSAYLKPGTAPGMKNGYWLNFGGGWAHLKDDDPAQMLAGASQRLFFKPATDEWMLVIEATLFVTNAVANVWTGVKHGGNDPAGLYTRLSGLDPAATLSIEPVP